MGLGAVVVALRAVTVLAGPVLRRWLPKSPVRDVRDTNWP
jgi:hypothetical protein